MVRVTRLIPVGALALLASGLAPALVGSLGAAILSASAVSAQEAAPTAGDAAPTRQGRRRWRRTAGGAGKAAGGGY